MPRVFSALKPTGSLTLGNLLGAIRPMVALQDDDANDGVFAVADLHSLTIDHDPRVLRARTLELAATLLACGIDPDRSLFFLQSHVRAHAELGYLMESTATVGELTRMVQYKEKARSGSTSTRTALLTYPALMAADILLYNTDVVPVGDDQRQHLELSRALARRFNAAYGDTFVVPEGQYSQHVARVMDLLEPTQKMGKTGASSAGVIALLDPADVVARKIARAVTDDQRAVRYDPAGQPGVANLVAILAALRGRVPADVAAAYTTYGQLKADLTAAVIGTLEPVQQAYASARANEEELRMTLARGAERARVIADRTLARAQAAIGLVAA